MVVDGRVGGLVAVVPFLQHGGEGFGITFFDGNKTAVGMGLMEAVEVVAFLLVLAALHKEKHLTKAQIGHFKKNNLENFRHLQEFRVEDASKYEVGQTISLEVLENVQKVDVTGRSIGKGFQGTVKRHNFSRGPMGHGSKNHRAPGSIGAGTTPSRVVKGKRMAGNMGNEKVTVTKLTVAKVIADKNLLLIKGAIPGPEGKLVTVKPTRTKWN